MARAAPSILRTSKVVKADWFRSASICSPVDQAGTNASAASRINCDWVARFTMGCGLRSAGAVLLNARCLLMSAACSSAFRCDPHSIACSVLTKVGMLNLLTRLRPFIDRCPDEVVARWASVGRSAAAEHPGGAYWRHFEGAGKARRDV